jgi:hypothetical protein
MQEGKWARGITHEDCAPQLDVSAKVMRVEWPLVGHCCSEGMLVTIVGCEGSGSRRTSSGRIH